MSLRSSSSSSAAYEKGNEMKRLSKRSPTLPLSLSSELSTDGNLNEEYYYEQNDVVPTNPNDDIEPLTVETRYCTLYCSATADLATTAEYNYSATAADVTTAERQHLAIIALTTDR
ncbi:hypothetical protein F511_46371 [Dorcoceras hygrometricum]|uniref:Uncharacterized protein n=1 Tax=Dorcoceras hygrometricum TaxID=472368 RepID=A0A2Z6ZTN4_9LAMI|nr:hypothetical protein F511_46371 [Dorcoceras hygrometricum]